jgi:hypothetical protein
MSETHDTSRIQATLPKIIFHPTSLLLIRWGLPKSFTEGNMKTA